MKPSLPGSIEQVLHETEIPRFFLDLRGHRRALDGFQHPYLERAIGVIYRPETERMSHYFETRLLDQFDSVIHIDRTRGVEPLERSSGGPCRGHEELSHGDTETTEETTLFFWVGRRKN